MLAGAIVAMYVAFNALEQTKQTMKERQGKCDERVAALELQVAELTNFIVFDTRRKRLIEDSLIHKIIKL